MTPRPGAWDHVNLWALIHGLCLVDLFYHLRRLGGPILVSRVLTHGKSPEVISQGLIRLSLIGEGLADPDQVRSNLPAQPQFLIDHERVCIVPLCLYILFMERVTLTLASSVNDNLFTLQLLKKMKEHAEVVVHMEEK